MVKLFVLVPSIARTSLVQEGMVMSPTRDDLQMFFEAYERATNDSNVNQFGLLYADQFMFGGPHGVQSVKKEDFLRVLPMRKTKFAALGLKCTQVESIEKTVLDERFVMAFVHWKVRFEVAGGQASELIVSASYILNGKQKSAKIILQIDHDDMMDRAKALGLG
jgi:hypothetical protein